MLFKFIDIGKLCNKNVAITAGKGGFASLRTHGIMVSIEFALLFDCLVKQAL